MKKAIGYLGPEGSFSHEFAVHIGKACKLLPLEPHKFRHFLNNGKIWKVVLPVVTAAGGQVQWVLDLLRDGSDGYYITSEVIWNVNCQLIGFGKKEQIKTIYSHSQPLDQCREFLLRMFNVSTQEVRSTSRAVEIVAARKDPTIAAIGTKTASKMYNVPIIQANIQDSSNNQTHFLVLGGRKPEPTGRDVTAILFGTPNEPGALVEVLLVFKVLKINMEHLFSLPAPSKRLGESSFFVDVKGHQEDDDLRVALKQIKGMTKYLKVLGSYPQANGAVNTN